MSPHELCEEFKTYITKFPDLSIIYAQSEVFVKRSITLKSLARIQRMRDARCAMRTLDIGIASHHASRISHHPKLPNSSLQNGDPEPGN